MFSSPSSRVSSVMPSRTRSTPSGRRSRLSTSSTRSSGKAAPCTASVVKRHDSCIFTTFRGAGHGGDDWDHVSALGSVVPYGQSSVFCVDDLIEVPGQVMAGTFNLHPVVTIPTLF